MSMRYALLDPERSPAATVERYLPDNYRVIGHVVTGDGHRLVIAGDDFAGWTLDDYVIPRLASGLHFAREVERVPATLPWSEVCVAMGVAERSAELTLEPEGRMAQIWLDGQRYSAPVTLGEAGITGA
jgi:hypothetical protein